MKKLIIGLLSLMLLTVFCVTVAAQNADSIYNNKKLMDSLYKKMLRDHYVPDTIVYKRTQALKRKVQGDSLRRSKDSLYHAQRKLFDSTYRKAIALRKNYDRQKDSTYKRQLFEVSRYDSAKRKTTTYRSSNDSLYRKKFMLYKLSDSLKRMDNMGRLKYDSMKRLYAVDVRYDSMHRFKAARGVRLDSMKKVLYLQNIKMDSLRIKKYLQFKKMQLQKLQADTVVLKNGYRTRELLTEITCMAGDTVYINNHYKKVIVKVFPHQKLRLSTTITYSDSINERDTEIFKKMGIALSRTNNSVIATVNGVKHPAAARDGSDKSNPQRDNIEDAICKDLNAENNARRPVVIELPDNVVIFLNTQYADASIENYVSNINAEINNGFLTMRNAGNAFIKSKYSTVTAGNLKKADLNLSSSKFTAGNITAMSVVSNTSHMQLTDCNAMTITSVSDEYVVEKAGSITGNKDFGKFNIQNLKDQLVLSGSNADVKINNVGLESPLIKISSKYADLKVPVYDLQNYSIYYEGSYKDVNKISSATSKTNSPATAFTAIANALDTVGINGKGGITNKTKFEAKAGDITGKYTKVDIVCPFCNVVFN